ncbi:MAG: radical SAM protein [Oligoflexia bacterium]|nr:radical SAM protein [Oligoflexia bacterium]
MQTDKLVTENRETKDSKIFKRGDEILNRIFPKREIKKTLLITPPDASKELFRMETARRLRYTNYPPYGLAVLATQLEKVGVTVEILNLNHTVIKAATETNDPEKFDFDAVWKEALVKKLKEFNPDMVGITCMFTMTHTSLKRVCELISTHKVPIGIGGVHVSNDVERVLKDISSADIAFLKEGDNSLKNFIQVVNKKSPVNILGQTILREGDEYVRFLNDLRPNSEDLNVLPSHDLITDLSNYSNHGTVGAFYWLRPKGTKFATALSNRGCRARCTFCSVRNFNGTGVRLRSARVVVDELEHLRDVHGITHVMWLDDDLLNDKESAMELFNEMVRRKLNMTWDATNGLIAFSCTEEMISAAEASGCVAVNIGMESGNAKILHEVRKPGKVETFLKAAEVLRRHPKIYASVLLMVGFPGETLNMVFDTIKVAKEMDLDWYRISPLQPLPNTPIYDSMVAQGLLQDMDTAKTVFQGGAYGRQIAIEAGISLSTPNFEEAFKEIKPDQIPNSEQITDIWFYMNYHLNFHRLFHEDRPIKIKQQMANLQNLTDVIAPENGFALYFLAVLQQRTQGFIEAGLEERLQRRLNTSDYWRDRLNAFGLSTNDFNSPTFGRASNPVSGL